MSSAEVDGPDQTDPPWFGPLMMGLIFLGAVAVAAIPLLLGIVLTHLLPGVGRLRDGSPMLLLHLLWIYPVIFVFGSMQGGVTKHLVQLGWPKGLTLVVEGLVMWGFISILFGVFFDGAYAAAFAAGCAVAAYAPFIWLLERGASEAAGSNPPTT